MGCLLHHLRFGRVREIQKTVGNQRFLGYFGNNLLHVVAAFFFTMKMIAANHVHFSSIMAQSRQSG
jgi:hypothetical protein